MYDVVIVGAGPAGLTAALYTARRQLRTLVIGKDIGGQAASTSVIENYPGVGAVDGGELMQDFKNQAIEFGAEVILGEVSAIHRQDDQTFTVRYGKTEVTTQSIILACGLMPRGLNVSGEAALTGKGVFYSTAGQINALHNKTAVVVGGGNSAIEAVDMLANVAQQVYLVHRRDRFRSEEILVRKMEAHPNVEQILNAEIKEIKGNDTVKEIVVEQHHSSDRSRPVTTRTIQTNAVFIHVGFMSKTDFIKDLVELNDKNEIVIQSDCSTQTPGIFAAGDITTMHYKQVIVSAGEGCKAALAVYNYCMQRAGKTVDIDQDWQVSSGEHFIRT